MLNQQFITSKEVKRNGMISRSGLSTTSIANSSELKKGDSVIVSFFVSQKDNTIFDEEKATVKTVLKSGKVKLSFEIGYGGTMTTEFIGKSGNVEKIN